MEEEKIVSKEIGIEIVVNNLLKNTRFENSDISTMILYLGDKFDQLDPILNKFGEHIQLCEILHQNKDDMELRLLIASYLILDICHDKNKKLDKLPF